MTLKARVGRIPSTRPNWSSPVTARYEFMTEIVTSKDGSEKRWAHRQNPRVQIGFGSMMKDDAAARLQADLANTGQDDPFILPMPCRYAASTDATGASTVTIDPMPFWVVEGARIVIEDATNQEAALVDSVAGTIATLSEALTNSFASGSRVYAAQSALFPANIAQSARTSVVGEAAFIFDALPARDPHPISSFVPDTYDDRDIFLWRPNWGAAVDFDFSSERGEHDPGIGGIDVTSLEGFSRLTQKMQFWEKSRALGEEVLSFFIRKKGRRGSFYIPTHRADIRALVQADAATSSLVVEGTDFFDAYDGHPIWTAVYVNFGSSYQVNAIDSMVVDTGNTVLTMADPWTNAIVSGKSLSWCPICRFASDTLTLQWVTDQVVDFAASVTTIRA